MRFGSCLPFLRIAQFGVAAFFLRSDPLVLALSGSVKVFANQVHALSESSSPDDLFGIGKTRSSEQPRRIFAVASPRRVGTLEVIGGLEFMTFLASQSTNSSLTQHFPGRPPPRSAAAPDP